MSSSKTGGRSATERGCVIKMRSMPSTHNTWCESRSRDDVALRQDYSVSLDDELDTNRVEERVRILRRDALNSDPPATLRQRSHNQVLHLMGESTRVRRDFFKTALQTVCRAAQAREGDDRYVPSQLGLSQPRMYKRALLIYREETFERLERLRSLVKNVTFPNAQEAGR